MAPPDEQLPTAAQFAALTARVFALEQTLKVAPPVTPRPVARAAEPEPAVPHDVSPPQVAAADDAVVYRPVEVPAELSLETRLGTVWFSRVGVVAILFGAAWLLKWAIDRGWISPPLRVTLGLVAGLVFLAAGERMWRRGVAITAYALYGVGNGVFYLSLWASFGLYHLVDSWVVFVPMLAITGWNGFRSWANDSPIFAGYALLLGYLIPVLMANGENHEFQLFFYLLLLGAAVGALAALKPWMLLFPVSFVATITISVGWATSFYQVGWWRPTLGFELAFLALFLAACRFATGRRPPAAEDAAAWTRLYPGVVLVSGALAMAALQPPVAHWYAWSAIIPAAAALALFATIAPAASPLLEQLRTTSFGLALAFLFLAVLLRFDGAALVRALTVEGVALMAIGLRWTDLRISRGFGLLALLLAWLAAAMDHYAGVRVFINPVMGEMAVVLAGLGAAAWLAGRGQGGGESGTLAVLDRKVLYGLVAGGALLLIWIMGLKAIYTAWWGGVSYVLPPQAAALATGSQFSYSAWCMVYGGVLLALGFWRRRPRVRWGALLLLVLAIAKVFLVDMSALSQGYRVLSFLGLGVLLLAVSYAYQRDWLGLRRPPAGS